MTNPPRNKGTKWETAVVRFLADRGLSARRKAPAGNQDQGDIEMPDVPGVIIEAKNAARTDLAGWVDEAVAEAARAGVPVGAVWHHRRNAASPGGGYVTMSGDHFTDLLLELRQLRERFKAQGGMAFPDLPSKAEMLRMRRERLEYTERNGGLMSEVARAELGALRAGEEPSG